MQLHALVIGEATVWRGQLRGRQRRWHGENVLEQRRRFAVDAVCASRINVGHAARRLHASEQRHEQLEQRVAGRNEENRPLQVVAVQAVRRRQHDRLGANKHEKERREHERRQRRELLQEQRLQEHGQRATEHNANDVGQRRSKRIIDYLRCVDFTMFNNNM